MAPFRPIFCVLAATLAAQGEARAAGGVVILAEGNVPQYRETVERVKSRLHGEVVEIDLARSDNPIDQVRGSSPKVVVAIGQRALSTVAGRINDVPIVFGGVLYPERHGLTGGNISGVPLEVPVAVQLERFHTVAPEVKRIGVIYSSASSSVASEATQAGGKLGVRVVTKMVGSPRDVAEAFDDLRSQIDALWLIPDTRVVNKDVFSYLLRASLDNNIPLFGFLDGFTEAGALASISPDYQDIGVRTGDLAKHVLDTGSLPAKVYSRGGLSINLKTAQLLGIAVADHVVRAASKVYR